MKNLFEGKVVLVTGAGSGIGQAAAVAYALNGATVIVSDIEASDTISMIKSKKISVDFIQADVGNLRDCSRLIRKTVERYGRIDIAFNSAGIVSEDNVSSIMSSENFNRAISANLCGIFYCMKYEIQAMLHQVGGIIINSTSPSGNGACDSLPGYVAANHGIIGLSQNAALTYACKNIRIHCVSPHLENVTLLETIDFKTKTASSLKYLRERQGKAEEFVGMVLWLSSEITGLVTAGFYPNKDSCSVN